MKHTLLRPVAWDSSCGSQLQQQLVMQAMLLHNITAAAGAGGVLCQPSSRQTVGVSGGVGGGSG